MRHAVIIITPDMSQKNPRTNIHMEWGEAEITANQEWYFTIVYVIIHVRAGCNAALGSCFTFPFTILW